MACCYPAECGTYAVTPMLVTPCLQTDCCEEVSMYYPCLPRCPKGMVKSCEKKPPQTPPRTPYHDDCQYESRREHSSTKRQPRSPPPTRKSSGNLEYCSSPHCHATCKPVKTKFVIPCYRYEDGRIDNQPTLLMRRACEVAVGSRARRKPFLVSSHCIEADREEHRYHSEDERGNFCFHIEHKKRCTPNMEQNHSKASRHPCQPCHSSPECQFTDCVYAKAVDPSTASCCYYCT